MKHLFSTLAILVLAYSFSFAQVKYSNEFLRIGVGARAHGMGLAQTAAVNDVTGAYWNPAGLSGFNTPFQIGVMHAEWFAGIAGYDYIGIAKRLDEKKENTLAFTLIRLGIDQIPNTLRLYEPDGSINYDNITEFSAADYALMGSYARKINIGDQHLRVGGTAKVVRRVIGSFGNSWGFGADLAAIYEVSKFKFALVARDIVPTFNSWSFNLKEEEKEIFLATGNEIPESSLEITRPTFSFGTSFATGLGEKMTLTVALDWDITTDGARNVLITTGDSTKAGINIDPRLGFEIDYKKFIYLRGGINNFLRATDNLNGKTEVLTFQPNFGVGLRFGRLRLDYALTDVGNVSQALFSNIFSVVLDFKVKQKTL